MPSLLQSPLLSLPLLRVLVRFKSLRLVRAVGSYRIVIPDEMMVPDTSGYKTSSFNHLLPKLLAWNSYSST